MSTIANQPTAYRPPAHQHQAGQFAAAYAREQSLSSREHLATDLTITTSEGDRITLNTTSYSSVDAYLYDGAGIVRNQGGAALVSEQLREITLASGSTFSFRVDGHLSDEELADLDGLLEGLDSVINHLKSGDMNGVLDSVKQLGGYDTFNAFAADIRYQATFTSSSSSAAAASYEPATLYAPGNESLANTDGPGRDQQAQPHVGGGRHLELDAFLDTLLDHLAQHQLKLMEHARTPLMQLLQHHQQKEAGDDQANPAQPGLAKFMAGLEQLAVDKAETKAPERATEN